LSERTIDAFMGFPPVPQELRARRIGHLVLNSSVDWPWSRYFCCLVAGHRDFVRKHPIATKRALRVMPKAADVCALELERAAQFLVDQGIVQRYENAVQTMNDVAYAKWREYDPEDTRFYALRLQEAGMIQSTPQQIIAQGTDWRFLGAETEFGGHGTIDTGAGASSATMSRLRGGSTSVRSWLVVLCVDS
jgi:NitT/TauT family transport system substrate-binding protein